MKLVVMGVSGCGKSTLGQGLAKALHLPYMEGDALHPEANIKKMSHGIPLDDEDRWPWLEQVAAALVRGHGPKCTEPANPIKHQNTATEQSTPLRDGLVVSCSALKKAYRDLLRDTVKTDLFFVFLYGDRAIIAERLMQRQDHFMPPALLQSQFDALEPPTDEPNVICVDYSLSPQQQIDTALYLLSASKAAHKQT